MNCIELAIVLTQVTVE